MVAWFKQTLTQGTLLGHTYHKNFRSLKRWISQNYKRFSKIKLSLFPPTNLSTLPIIQSNWNPSLRSNLCPNTSCLHAPTNVALIQPTSPLRRGPPVPKDNFICLMCAFSNINPPLYVIAVTYFMAFNITFHPLSFRLTNFKHTKSRGLGYKQWLY